MNIARRLKVGVTLIAMAVFAPVTRAQVMQQLPADALVVFKVNNPENVSKKVAALTQRLGLAQIEPGLADPLGMLKKQMNIKEGLDGAGEAALALYENPGQGDPRVLVLVPVTDFKAFMANLPDVKQEGELSVFQPPDNGGKPVYAQSWGKYAAMSDDKTFFAQKPAGIQVSGASKAQLDKNDVVMYANVKLLSSKALPMLREAKGKALADIERELKANAQFNQKFTPAVRALVQQLIAVAEQALTDGQGATVALNITDKGINTTVLAEFAEGSYAGNLVKGIKTTDANLLAGLPNRKYFFFAGATVNPETTTKLLGDFVDPIQKELVAAGPEGKVFTDMIDSARKSFANTSGFAAGYAAPTGAPGTQSVIQPVVVMQGNAQQQLEAQRQYFAASQEFMKLMIPPEAGMTVVFKNEPNAKNVAGTALDAVTMQFKADPNNPQGAQMDQVMKIMYGPDGMSGAMGAVNDKTFVMALGGGDELVGAAVAAAKSNDAGLSQLAHVKSVSDQLPQNRAMVYFIAPDNIATTVLNYMAQFGMRVPLKLQPDIPPIGISFGTEGNSLRIDTVFTNELIENIVAVVFQAQMMRQGGGARPGAL